MVYQATNHRLSYITIELFEIRTGVCLSVCCLLIYGSVRLLNSNRGNQNELGFKRGPKIIIFYEKKQVLTIDDHRYKKSEKKRKENLKKGLYYSV